MEEGEKQDSGSDKLFCWETGCVCPGLTEAEKYPGRDSHCGECHHREISHVPRQTLTLITRVLEGTYSS